MVKQKGGLGRPPFAARGFDVLSRKAGEEGDPTKLGEVRGRVLRSFRDFPSSTRCFATGPFFSR